MITFKSVMLFIILAIFLLLTACASIERIEVEIVDCEGGSGGIEECTVKVTIKTKSIGSGFDSGKLSMDTGQSTVDFSQSAISATLVQKRNGVIIGTYDFQFNRSGDSWIPADSQALNSWIAANITDYDAMEIGVSSMAVVSAPGTNVMVAEVVYDNEILADDSESWYVNSNNDDNQMMN